MNFRLIFKDFFLLVLKLSGRRTPTSRLLQEVQASLSCLTRAKSSNRQDRSKKDVAVQVYHELGALTWDLGAAVRDAAVTSPLRR